MSDTAQAVLLTVFILTTSVWIGGYVAIAVVARVASATLGPADRVEFFRSLGRSYLWVGVPALAVALGTGAALLREHDRDALLVTTAVVAVVLVILLAVAVAQARRMTRLRRRAREAAKGEQLAAMVRRGGLVAGILRAVLGLLSLTLVVLGCFLAT